MQTRQYFLSLAHFPAADMSQCGSEISSKVKVRLNYETLWLF